MTAPRRRPQIRNVTQCFHRQPRPRGHWIDLFHPEYDPEEIIETFSAVFRDERTLDDAAWRDLRIAYDVLRFRRQLEDL